MTTLAHPFAPVHSNPPEVGPYMRALGYQLGYHSQGLLEAVEYRAANATLDGCPSVEPEDRERLDDAYDVDFPGPPRLPLADWIEVQAAWFRSQDTDAANWLASEVQELADLCRALHAATVDQFDGRRAALAKSERNAEFAAFLDAEADADERLAGAQPW